MITIVCILLWMAYSCLEGWREGWYWHYKTKAGVFKKELEHEFWTVQRAITVTFFCICSGLPLYASIPFCFLSFSFLHDGCYYWHRNILSNDSIYKKKFFDMSTTSTAKLSMTTLVRTILFVISLGVLFFIK